MDFAIFLKQNGLGTMNKRIDLMGQEEIVLEVTSDFFDETLGFFEIEVDEHHSDKFD